MLHFAGARLLLDPLKGPSYTYCVVIDRRITNLTMEAISEFDLLVTDEPLVVALSGGKDSLTLCLILRELGIESVPVVVDMGYAAGWAERVRAQVSSVGLDPQVIDVRRLTKRSDANLTLTDNLAALDPLTSIGGTFTPCTYCYNAKAIALEKSENEF